MRVDRSFAFVDLCGFTRFTDTHGDEDAVEVLTRFRALVRKIASDHAVRVDKWLGDGAMFVSTDDRRLLDALLELMGRGDTTDVALPLRAGASKGPVILLEGDDYVGGAVEPRGPPLQCRGAERAARDEPARRRGAALGQRGLGRARGPCPGSCSASTWCASRSRGASPPSQQADRASSYGSVACGRARAGARVRDDPRRARGPGRSAHAQPARASELVHR